MKNTSKVEKQINLKFKNKTYLEHALIHKSFNEKVNNEKLEFLGDRVIGLVLSEKLYKIYPKENEGSLDKRFAKLVNRKTCAKISWLMGLNLFIKLGDQNKKITEKDEKILSDACESLIGAIYLDKGYDATKEFVLKFWKKELKKSNVTILDSKTMLQEYSLKMYKKLPIYKVISSQGPKHKPTFKISVFINNLKEAFGNGSSKQNAEQKAAFNFLKKNNIS